MFFSRPLPLLFGFLVAHAIPQPSISSIFGRQPVNGQQPLPVKFDVFPEVIRDDQHHGHVPAASDVVEPAWICPDYLRLDPDTVKCIGVDVERASARCPTGCTLMADACECVLQEAYVEQCPDGYELITDGKFFKKGGGKSCSRVSRVDPHLRCDSLGQRLVDGQCVGTEIIPAERYCRPGAHLSGDLCLKEFSVPFEVRCPSGFENVEGIPHGRQLGERKVDFFGLRDKKDFKEPNYQPPPSPGLCIKRTWLKPEPTCPRGFRLENEVACTRELVQPAEIECPPSFSLDVSSNVCVSEATSPSHERCPDGYELDMVAKQCVQIKTRSPTASCREGFQLTASGRTCARVIEEPPMMKCTNPDDMFDGASCTERLAIEPSAYCDEGVLRGDSCVTSLNRLGRTVCPHGFTLNEAVSKCVTSEVQEAVLECAHGYHKDGSSCVAEEMAEADLSCPPGYNTNESQCTKERVDETALRCPSSKYELLGAECLATTWSSPLLDCGPGYGLARSEEGDVCEAREIAEVEITCPPGFSSYQGHCIRQRILAAEYGCNDGGKYDGVNCVRKVSLDPVPQCPSGYHVGVNGCVLEATIHTSTKRGGIGTLFQRKHH